MKNLIYLLILLTITTVCSCKPQINSDLQFAYSIDKEGVYIYSLKSNKSKQIYSTSKVFHNDYFKLLNDSILQVGHQTRKKNTLRDYVHVIDSIYHINVHTNTSFLASTKDYEHFEYKTLNIKTRHFDKNGNLISQKDTALACGGRSSSSKAIRFCDFKRYYTESEIVGGKKNCFRTRQSYFT